ncbi:metal-dependent protein hydrolase [Entophlyctis helioformis]|nr:metal-dependent protein hydrolase [Entophlyctis helioformis]
MPTIVTHSGSFHADESLAVFMLKLLPEYKDASVVRTRDAEVIKTGDIVVDVGGVYDPATHRYDHHQREFTDTFDKDHAIRLSSAGLVYKHFGKRVIRTILGWDVGHDAQVDQLFIKIYDDLIQGFDGVDNGVLQYPVDLKPAYKETTSISHRVASLNPWWNQPSTDEDLNTRFLKAVEMAGAELLEKVQYLGLSWLPARKIVEDAMASRKDIDESGRILVLDQFCPWKGHLEAFEEELKLKDADKPYYVIYEDSSKQWRIQAVPVTPSSFASRKPLPEPWMGLRDEALSTLSGIDGCVFVHASGFIGGNKTKDGALKMAKKALQM